MAKDNLYGINLSTNNLGYVAFAYLIEITLIIQGIMGLLADKTMKPGRNIL